MAKHAASANSDDKPSEDPTAERVQETESPPPAEEPLPDWETRYKYLLADLENYRRRSERERESLSQQTRARIIRQLLPIYEAFHYARDAVGRLAADDPVRQGLELLYREWQTFLKHEGVEPVARPGERFQSDVHEAVGESPVNLEYPEGVVVEVVQQGYRFFGGLLRPAKVIVARATAPPAGSPESAARNTTAAATGEAKG